MVSVGSTRAITGRQWPQTRQRKRPAPRRPARSQLRDILRRLPGGLAQQNCSHHRDQRDRVDCDQAACDPAEPRRRAGQDWPAKADLRFRKGECAWYRHARQRVQHRHRLAEARQLALTGEAGSQVRLDAAQLVRFHLSVQIGGEELTVDMRVLRGPKGN